MKNSELVKGKQNATFKSTIKTVLCAFFGVAKEKNYESFNPILIVLAGLFLVICFVVFLLFIISFIVG
tara:strand:- start:503 stop:706 length:204 start_codon:yes stop_codon:yes gene_type:complete